MPVDPSIPLLWLSAAQSEWNEFIKATMSHSPLRMLCMHKENSLTWLYTDKLFGSSAQMLNVVTEMTAKYGATQLMSLKTGEFLAAPR